jgi:hypothetical protein
VSKSQQEQNAVAYYNRKLQPKKVYETVRQRQLQFIPTNRSLTTWTREQTGPGFYPGPLPGPPGPRVPRAAIRG